MHVSSQGAGMDIHTYLHEWHSFEPHRCTLIEGDLWFFSFSNLTPLPQNYPGEITCDVTSLHGVGIIEDLIKACIDHRKHWSYALKFDRSEEFFQGFVTDASGTKYTGLDSLNPGIALLTAYLNTLKKQRTP